MKEKIKEKIEKIKKIQEKFNEKITENSIKPWVDISSSGLRSHACRSVRDKGQNALHS